MALRSFSDVPNRVVRIFLQQAGRQYDVNRGLTAFTEVTPLLKSRFNDCCAYCGSAGSLLGEHLVPMNRLAVGLHAWGNVVPACRPCNVIKAAAPWEQHRQLDDARRAAIQGYVDEMRYAPNVDELREVVGKLYELSDTQTRALIEFGLVASQPYIAGLDRGSR